MVKSLRITSVHECPALRSVMDANTPAKYQDFADLANMATMMFVSKHFRKASSFTNQLYFYTLSNAQYCPSNILTMLPSADGWIGSKAETVAESKSATLIAFAGSYLREVVSLSDMHNLAQLTTPVKGAVLLDVSQTKESFLSRHDYGENEILRDIAKFHPLRKLCGYTDHEIVTLSYSMRVRYHVYDNTFHLTFSDIYTQGAVHAFRFYVSGVRVIRFWSTAELVSRFIAAGYTDRFAIARDAEGLLWTPSNLVSYSPEPIVGLLFCSL